MNNATAAANAQAMGTATFNLAAANIPHAATVPPVVAIAANEHPTTTAANAAGAADTACVLNKAASVTLVAIRHLAGLPISLWHEIGRVVSVGVAPSTASNSIIISNKHS